MVTNSWFASPWSISRRNYHTTIFPTLSLFSMSLLFFCINCLHYYLINTLFLSDPIKSLETDVTDKVILWWVTLFSFSQSKVFYPSWIKTIFTFGSVSRGQEVNVEKERKSTNLRKLLFKNFIILNTYNAFTNIK